MTPAVNVDRDRMLQLLRVQSFERKEVLLASGRTSDFYVDCKRTVLTAEGHWLAGRILRHEIGKRDPECKGVGGLTLGADPLASAVSLISYLSGPALHAFLVRKEAKGHGTNQWIEGLEAFHPGDRVAIVEDVVTTGGSALFAVERAREAGLVPTGVFALVDRQEGGAEAITSHGLPTYAAFSRADFLE